MQPRTEPSRAIASTSDLVVLAPWRAGIIEADEAILPMTRCALTFRTIFQIRKTARESLEQTAFVDPIDRLEQIHSFRLKAVPQGMLLSVTYDAGWQPYARALWKPAGPFLDLLCCHCADYGLARETALARWSDWIRTRELVSDIFYSAGRQTVGDLLALTQLEKVQRTEVAPAAGDLKLAGFSSESAVEAAERFRRTADPREVNRQALAILTAMFRLTRYYGADINRPGPLQADALTLLRAVHSQVDGWVSTALPKELRAGFERELAWFEQSWTEREQQKAPDPVRNEVQRGVLTRFDSDDAPVTHGALLHFCVRPGEGAKALKALAELPLSREGDPAPADLPLSRKGDPAPADKIFRTLALTYEGMRRLGLPADILAAMPEEFRLGAAARAPQVGDLNAFHPREWAHLPDNWDHAAGRPKTPDEGRIDVAAVDVVIQLRTRAKGKPIGLMDPDFPLIGEIQRLAALPGLKLLSVEAMAQADPDKPGYDHLGLKDGISQPTLEAKAGTNWPDKVEADALLADPGGTALLRGGSFLAIRRMPVDREAFDALVESVATTHRLKPAEVVAKIVGRDPDGHSPAGGTADNDFTYSGDPDGALCPRQSHARRANPRVDPLDPAAPIPRIMRRGMSFHPDPATNKKEYGSLFMAYCGNLAEQYEVVLAWLNGGNSSRIGSFANDPLCGVRASTPTTYRVVNGSNTLRMDLPAAAQAFVKLSWSLYLYVPSIRLVEAFAGFAERAPAIAAAEGAALLARQRAHGVKVIRDLLDSKADAGRWRLVLDETTTRSDGTQAAVWAAIRHDFGGQLQTPVGHLVGSRALVLEVLRDDGHRFSVREAGRRVAASLGRFHLATDAWTEDYRREYRTCNEALRAIDEDEAYALARTVTIVVLTKALEAAHPLPARIDLVRNLLEVVTGRMAPAWFGLPDGEHVLDGASDWRDIGARVPLFPGDFWNSSRFAFNPFTSAETERLSALHGRAMMAGVRRHVKAKGRFNLTGSVARAIGNDRRAYPTTDDVGRVLAGAMMGWIATTLGSGARIFDTWLTEGELVRQRQVWLEIPEKERTAARARTQFGDAMERTFCRAPVPECKHRVATGNGVRLGNAVLDEGQFVIVSLESGVAEAAETSILDSHLPFGDSADAPNPPHGCPARSMALGHLLGMLAGAMEACDMRHAGGRFTADLRPG